MRTYDVIVKPVITEKSMNGVGNGTYSFVVNRLASKTQIKHAIQALFNVTVTSISTSIVKGKRKRTGARRVEVEESIWKKAIITVGKDQKIALFEPGGEEEKKKKK